MNEAATTFEKLDYLSSFIHATLGIPRLYVFIGTMMMDSFAALHAINYRFGTTATMAPCSD
jgi:hypothetical protein